jgi:hypothetical protein
MVQESKQILTVLLEYILSYTVTDTPWYPYMTEDNITSELALESESEGLSSRKLSLQDMIMNI